MREAILDATERLLTRKGYRRMTMDDIAAESGVARRTIYLRFPGKEQVALESIDRVVERLLDRLRAIAGEPRPAEERLRRMLMMRVLFRFDSVSEYHQSFTEMFAAIRAAYLARREGYFEAEAALFAGVLEEARAAGALDCDDLDATAHTLLLATNALLPFSLSARELGARDEVERRVSRLADLVVAGLRHNPDHSRTLGEDPRPTGKDIVNYLG
jgi:AcrR family transcriptional regulator